MLTKTSAPSIAQISFSDRGENYTFNRMKCSTQELIDALKEANKNKASWIPFNLTLQDLKEQMEEHNALFTETKRFEKSMKFQRMMDVMDCIKTRYFRKKMGLYLKVDMKRYEFEKRYRSLSPGELVTVSQEIERLFGVAPGHKHENLILNADNTLVTSYIGVTFYLTVEMDLDGVRVENNMFEQADIKY